MSGLTGGMPTRNEHQLLTVKEAAYKLRISETTMYRRLQAGDENLHGVKVGRQWRIPSQSISAIFSAAGF